MNEWKMTLVLTPPSPLNENFHSFYTVSTLTASLSQLPDTAYWPDVATQRTFSL